jgi:hypothetical protein
MQADQNDKAKWKFTLRESRSALPVSSLELYVAPEPCGKLSLLGRVSSSRRAVGLHPTWVFTVADVGVWIPEFRCEI